MALKDTDYLYLSSNIRARQGGKSFFTNLVSLLECKNIDDIYALVVTDEKIEGKTKKEKIEASLDKRLEECINYVMRLVPNRSIYKFLLYEYDLCNLKSLIKGEIRGTEVDDILYSFGAISLSELKFAVEKRVFNVLPKHMAEGARNAIDAYAKTKNPALIDIILDKACFMDILENAKESGCKMFIEATKRRIDIINILAFIRIARLRAKGKREMFLEASIEGGNLGCDMLAEKIDDYDGNLEELLKGTDYALAVSNLGSNYTPALLAKSLDEVYLAHVKGINYIPFGAEIPYGYVISTIYEIKNVKTVLAGLLTGVDAKTIRERVRFGYV